MMSTYEMSDLGCYIISLELRFPNLMMEFLLDSKSMLKICSENLKWKVAKMLLHLLLQLKSSKEKMGQRVHMAQPIEVLLTAYYT